MKEKKNNTKTRPEFKQFEHSHNTPEGRIERSVYVLRDPRGFMIEKQIFLFSMGVTPSEYLTALNIASSGELLKVALSNN